MKVLYVLWDGTLDRTSPRPFSREWRLAWVLRIVSRILGRPYVTDGGLTVDRKRGVMMFLWETGRNEP